MCDGNFDITVNKLGVLSSGFGNDSLAYVSGWNCGYRLAVYYQAFYVSGISLTFDYFDILATDRLLVYDGASEDSPLLASFSGSTPPFGSIMSASPTVLVKFITENNGTGKGCHCHSAGSF
jgi:hypothetical protein